MVTHTHTHDIIIRIVSVYACYFGSFQFNNHSFIHLRGKDVPEWFSHFHSVIIYSDVTTIAEKNVMTCEAK